MSKRSLIFCLACGGVFALAIAPASGATMRPLAWWMLGNCCGLIAACAMLWD